MRPTSDASIIDDNQFNHQAANIMEALYNLTYLICEEAEYAGRVRHYASMSQDRLAAMNRLLKETSQ